MAEYEVGQKVIIRDVNENQYRGPERGTVVKVGRKLVYVATEGFEAWPRAYRIETTRRNDQYEHSWIQTLPEYGEDIRVEAATKRLREYGVTIHGYGSEVLEAVLGILDAQKEDEDRDAEFEV